MTQYGVSQVGSTLSIMRNEDFRTVWHKKLFMKSWYNSKNYCGFLFVIFDVLISSDNKYVDSFCKQHAQ